MACSSLAMGQTACDSLDIEVTYYPFSDSLIQVSVTNHAQTFFSYPVFTILDSNNDTVAHEDLNFFGIGTNSVHTLKTHPGMPASNTFSGTLQLYYMTVDSFAVCTWPMNFVLCPDTCKMFFPYLTNYGSMSVTGDASWQILNNNAQPVASGMFTLDTNTQYATDSVCLAEGNYTLKVTDINLTLGGQKMTGITNNVFSAAPDTTFNDTVAIVPFTLFEPCITTTSIKAPIRGGTKVHIFSHDNSIVLQNVAGNPIGNITVYSIDGKKVLHTDCRQPKYNIGLANVPTGIYIVSVRNETGIFVEKVFIEN